MSLCFHKRTWIFIDCSVRSEIWWKINQFSLIYYLSLHLILDDKFKEIARFEPSQRGSVVLYYDGKRFTRDGMFADSTNWRCCYFRDKCRARAITKQFDGETRVRITNPIHTCTEKRKQTQRNKPKNDTSSHTIETDHRVFRLTIKQAQIKANKWTAVIIRTCLKWLNGRKLQLRYFAGSIFFF